VPIIGIGLYPRLVTDTYRVSIEALVQREANALAQLSHVPGKVVMRSQSPGLWPAVLQPFSPLKAPSLS